MQKKIAEGKADINGLRRGIGDTEGGSNGADGVDVHGFTAGRKERREGTA